MITSGPAPQLTAVWNRLGAAAGSAREATLCARVFWAWLVVRTAVWTTLAALTQDNASIDLIEWLGWGREWQWGYHKHPPLPAWVAEAFAQLSPGSPWGVYLAGYLAAAVCFWAAWRLGRELLPPRLALLGALSLEGVVFLNYEPADFSNNVALNACWALAVVAFHRALRTDRLRWWLATGAAMGLALLCKYTAAFLAVPMAAFLLAYAPARPSLRKRGPYLAALAALAVFAPHVVWMVRHNFETISYGLQRAESSGGWLGHLTNPAMFAASQLIRLLPLIGLLLPVLSWRRATDPAGRGDRAFLAATVAGPVLLHLLVSLAVGFRLRDIWGSPLWTFAGVYLLAVLRADGSGRAVRRSLSLWAAVVVAFWTYAVVKNYGSAYILGTQQRTQFPGKLLAGELTRQWRERTGVPLPFAAGEPWLAGNVGCYSPDRPSVYGDGAMGYCVMDPAAAPWASDEALRTRGGVILWDATQTGDDLPPWLRPRFPTADVRPALELPYATRAAITPVRVGVAFVWPERP
jgi:4-amino-4-deoxy-L-arabinose transferase-like glycosyltransferase